MKSEHPVSSERDAENPYCRIKFKLEKQMEETEREGDTQCSRVLRLT